MSITTRLRTHTTILLWYSALTPVAFAQWTTTVLHPDGALSSEAHSTTATDQVGVVEFMQFYRRAVLWNGDAQSFVDLTPDNAVEALGYAGGSGLQSGVLWLDGGGGPHPTIWTGSADSWVDLGGPGYVYAQSPTHVVGESPFRQAAVWDIQTLTHRPLHPGAYTRSRAWDTLGDLQVGSVEAGNLEPLASLWRGNVASHVLLHPPMAEWSEALATDGVRHGGYARMLGDDGLIFDRAVIWNGSQDDFTDIDPPIFGPSRVNAMDPAGVQVGQASNRAAFWMGTAESFLDLSSFLGSEYVLSEALGLHVQGDTVYVAGWAHNSTENRREAILWIGTLPSSCPADIDGDGDADAEDFFAYLDLFANGDDGADIDGDGDIDAEDFFGYLDLFAQGC